MDKSGKTVASRIMKVKPKYRCFCMWQCACVCVGIVARVDATDICEEMPIGAIYEAGFVTDESNEEFNWLGFVPLCLAWLLFVLFCG